MASTPRSTLSSSAVGAAASQAAAAPVPRRKSRALILLRSNKAAMASAVVLALLLLVAIFAPMLAPYDPAETHSGANHQPGFWAGNTTYFLGTDHQGRDILSRLIYGARISVVVGLTAVCISVLLGVTAGAVSGFYPGKVGDTLMRIADIQLSLPAILLALALVGVLGPSTFNVIVILGVTGWVIYARVVRGRVLSLKTVDYVSAARAIGCGDRRVLGRHILPNVVSPIVVLATLEVATVIIAEATLSFLGVGIQPPTPTWGGMLSDGRLYLRTSWWIATVPGITITLAVLSINLLGDWVRDSLDPRFRL